MTDHIALWLAGFLVAAIVLDLLANGGGVLVFLVRKLMDLIETVAVWR